MRRSTGAILRDTRPETIITSACRGLARNTSAPKRARSLRDEVAFIISIAQQARPNVAGHSDDLRAQLIKESSRVVRTSGKASAITFSRPITLNQTPSGRGSLPRLRAPRLHVVQRPGFRFRLAPRALAPVKRAFLYNVDVAGEQQSDKHHHLQISKPAHGRALRNQRLEHRRPRHEEDHLDIKE